MTREETLKEVRRILGPDGWAGQLPGHNCNAVGILSLDPRRFVIMGSGRGWAQALKDLRRRMARADGHRRPFELRAMAEFWDRYARGLRTG